MPYRNKQDIFHERRKIALIFTASDAFFYAILLKMAARLEYLLQEIKLMKNSKSSGGAKLNLIAVVVETQEILHINDLMNNLLGTVSLIYYIAYNAMACVCLFVVQTVSFLMMKF